MDYDTESPQSEDSNLFPDIDSSEPFQPLFEKVKVSDAVKDGETVKFTISCQTPNGTKIANFRQYEDFEWLHHCLITNNNTYAVITPPLPPKPAVEPKNIASPGLMKGDEYQKDSKKFELYLKLMIAHDAFGRDKILQAFLCEKTAPTRTRIKKGIMTRLSTAVDDTMKGYHKDVDEYFGAEKDWVITYSAYQKAASLNFNKMTYSTWRMSQAYNHIATALNLGGLYKDEYTLYINKLCTKLAEAYEDTKHGLEVQVENDDNTLGFQLEHYTRYLESEKEMLLRRLTLLIEYENSVRALEKAKPPKKAAAEEAKDIAEKVYNECTDKARVELKSFHDDRVQAAQKGLENYADAQIKTARDTYALLAKSLSAIKQTVM